MPTPAHECLPSDDKYVTFYFGLIVTGEVEEQHLPKIFKSFNSSYTNYPFCCQFEVIARIGQLTPRTSTKKHNKPKMVGTKQNIPDKDEEKISIPAKRYLGEKPCSYVILIDDLERKRTIDPHYTPCDIFRRYRDALDQALQAHNKRRVSVHFMVNMLEAYYFADAKAINQTLNLNLQDYSSDVETINHPKSDLKQLYPGFDEIQHGGKILEKLDVEHILSNPTTCGSLRTLFLWIWQAIGRPQPDKYHCVNGKIWQITAGQ